MASSVWFNDAWRHVAMAALLWAVTTAKPSRPVAYCASDNTATMSGNFSTFQSEGLCYTFCVDVYALAVLQGNDCWCTNYVPSESSQVSTDKCDNSCPGYPDDYCGGAGGLYGYVTLTNAVSGTASASSTSSSTSSSTTVNTSPTVSQITSDGVVRTVTVTPTVTASSNSGSGVNSSGHSGLSAGAAAGIAIGVVVGVVGLAAAIIFLLIRRRRRRQAEDEGGVDSPSQRGGSSSGTMGTPLKPEVTENRYVGGSDGKTMAESWENSAQGRRRSTLMPIDPRMDPFNKGIYRSENKSHESLNTLRDDQDYSRRVLEPPRVLRATNPDPDDY